MARMPTQLELRPRTWGGKRPGAGRKPSGRKVGVPHRTRPSHQTRHPVHVTLRALRGLPSLRADAVFPAVRRGLADADLSGGSTSAAAHPAECRARWSIPDLMMRGRRVHAPSVARANHGAGLRDDSTSTCGKSRFSPVSPTCASRIVPVTESRVPAAGALAWLMTVSFTRPSRRSNMLSGPIGRAFSTVPTTVTLLPTYVSGDAMMSAIPVADATAGTMSRAMSSARMAVLLVVIE